MTRDALIEALKELRERLPYQRLDDRRLLDEAIAALSSSCACGGKEPTAEFAAWMDADIHASLSALAAPFRLPRTGMVHLYGEDSRIGNHRKSVRILFFNDPPGEKPDGA